MIDVTLLGCGALLPLPERALTSVLLTYAGHSILFDCGEGTQTAARRAGVSLMKTDLIALTHYHGDHIFGLPGLLQSMGTMNRTEPLYITGPGDAEKELEALFRMTGYLPFPIRFLKIGAEGLDYGSIAGERCSGAYLIPFSTEHRTPSRGYRFCLKRPGKFHPERARALGVPVECWGTLQKGTPVSLGDRTVQPCEVLGEERRGLTFVFSGDTEPCDGLLTAAKDADLFICEATYGENGQAQIAHEHGHMTFAQAGEIAQKAGVRRLWTAHYSQMITDPRNYIENARAYFPAAECGTDGKTVTMIFEEK